MSRKGDCWDNAVAESFFATIKGEMIDHADQLTRGAPITSGGEARVYATIGVSGALSCGVPSGTQVSFTWQAAR
jgi:transposase InsO family protein